MRAMFLAHDAGTGSLAIREAPQPVPRSGELLIRIHAAGVTPTELLWYPTLHTKSGEPRYDVIPGHEFSGVVEFAGSSDFQIGEDVYGMNDWFSDGATADYCIALPSQIARKPAGVAHAAAASVPIGALTAWQGGRRRNPGALMACAQTVRPDDHGGGGGGRRRKG